MTPPGLSGRRCLVTGAGGFVGVNLCRALAQSGALVHGVVRPGGNPWRLEALAASASVHQVNLACREAVDQLFADLCPELVFHCAAANAYAEGGATGLVTDTLLTLAHVLDAACRTGKPRVVLLGSSLAYGASPCPHREEAPLRPSSPRGASKAASTLLALEIARRTSLPLVELRLFSVYGPWEHPHRLVPTAIRAGLEDRPLPLTGPGIRRDFVFVDDVAAACLEAAVAAGVEGRVVNVGAGVEVSNEELVEVVAQVLGKPVHTLTGQFAPRSTDTSHWRADNHLAADLLGWRARPLGEGIAATVAWTENQVAREGS